MRSWWLLDTTLPILANGYSFSCYSLKREQVTVQREQDRKQRHSSLHVASSVVWHYKHSWRFDILVLVAVYFLWIGVPFNDVWTTLRRRSCWVCYATDEDDETAAWVKPCQCRGTTKWVNMRQTWNGFFFYRYYQFNWDWGIDLFLIRFLYIKLFVYQDVLSLCIGTYIGTHVVTTI